MSPSPPHVESTVDLWLCEDLGAALGVLRSLVGERKGELLFSATVGPVTGMFVAYQSPPMVEALDSLSAAIESAPDSAARTVGGFAGKILASLVPLAIEESQGRPPVVLSHLAADDIGELGLPLFDLTVADDGLRMRLVPHPGEHMLRRILTVDPFDQIANALSVLGRASRDVTAAGLVVVETSRSQAGQKPARAAH